jgi:hypothetical protein
MYKVARKEYSAGLAATRRTRGRGDQSQAGDAVPSGTSLVRTTGGTMRSHPSAGRHRHRRLIVCVLALAVGATLCVAASPALASSEAARYRAAPKIALNVSPSSPLAGSVAKVSGNVWPVEAVGKVVSLAVQRKSRGRWILVAARGQMVRFTPPNTWRGTFDMELQMPPMFPSSTWRGEVVYTLRAKGTSLVQHLAEYDLTSATGFFFNDWSYGGVSIKTASWLQTQQQGHLTWYFADSGDIPIDSYDGDAYLTFTGTSIATDPEGHTTELPQTVGASGVMWEVGAYGETKRPLASFEDHGVDEIGLMSETRTRDRDDPPGSTSISTWDLSSDPMLNVIGGRSGFFKWAYTPTEKGSYRLRATITGGPTPQHPAGTVWAQSSWRAFTVR